MSTHSDRDLWPTRFAVQYEPVTVRATPSIPSYPLPLSEKAIGNYADVIDKLKPGTEVQAILLRNGFAALPTRHDDFVKACHSIRSMKLPTFVSADSVLHLYHLQFDEILCRIETAEFIPKLTVLGRALIDRLLQERSRAVKKEATEGLDKALAFLLVGYERLAGPGLDLPVPRHVRAWADADAKAMEPHAGFANSAIFNYPEDFSQYVPRGHYTRSEMLEKYFLAMMWFGRMTFLAKGGEPHGSSDEPFLVSFQEAQHQTMAAGWLVRALQEVTVGDERGWALWERIRSVISFMVGISDDPGPPEYDGALREALGAGRGLARIFHTWCEKFGLMRRCAAGVFGVPRARRRAEPFRQCVEQKG